jgi:hypothetical protein
MNHYPFTIGMPENITYLPGFNGIEKRAVGDIASLSSEKAVKDVSIEEAGIDDIIKIAYGK